MRKVILDKPQKKSKNLPVLTVGLTAPDKVLFIQKYVSSKDIRDRIIEILTKKLDQAVKESETKDLYTVPNWDFAQADNLGYRRALRECITLLSFTHEVDHDR